MPDAGRPADHESDPFYISASGGVEQRTRVLKSGDSFAIFDPNGDIPRSSRIAAGLFHRDTRYLSQLELRINGERPLLLSSGIGDDNVMFTADLTNPDFRDGDRINLAKDLIHLHRTTFLWEGACYKRLTVRNFAGRA